MRYKQRLRSQLVLRKNVKSRFGFDTSMGARKIVASSNGPNA